MATYINTTTGGAKARGKRVGKIVTASAFATNRRSGAKKYDGRRVFDDRLLKDCDKTQLSAALRRKTSQTVLFELIKQVILDDPTMFSAALPLFALEVGYQMAPKNMRQWMKANRAQILEFMSLIGLSSLPAVVSDLRQRDGDIEHALKAEYDAWVNSKHKTNNSGALYRWAAAARTARTATDTANNAKAAGKLANAPTMDLVDASTKSKVTRADIDTIYKKG